MQIYSKLRSSWLGRVTVTAALLACCGAAAYWLGAAKNQARAPHPVLSVPEEALNLGEVFDDPEYPWTLPIQNETGTDLHIDKFVTSCGCAKIAQESMTLKAGERADLNLTIDFRARTPKDRDEPIRDFEVSVWARLGTGASAGPWNLHGRVRQPFALSSRFIYFPDLFLGQVDIKPQQLVVTCREPVQNIRCQCDGSRVDVKITRLSTNPDTFQCQLVARKGLPLGEFGDKLLISAVTHDGREARCVIPLFGTVKEEVQTLPEFLALGPTRIGTPIAQTLLLESRLGQPFRVLKVEAKDDGIVLEKTQAAPKARQEVQLRYQPSKKGPCASVITLSLEGGHPPRQIKIALPVF